MAAISMSQTAIHAVIEVGSAGPKLLVAQIDPDNNKILKVLHDEQYSVFYQVSLGESGNNTLSSQIIEEGVEAFEKALIKAKSLGAGQIVAIATSAFRKACNAKEAAAAICKKTEVNVHIIEQEHEGKLAFQAACAQMDIHVEDLVVWDIGGGSTQLIARNPEDGSYAVHGIGEGSWAFMRHIVEQIQQRGKECKTPNPLSVEDIKAARQSAKELAGKVGEFFREKIKNPQTKVVGVGSVFASVAKRVSAENSFTIEDLTQAVNDLIGKDDEQVGGGRFAFVEGSNPLLVLGFMDGLGIQQMDIVEVNNTYGVMASKEYWK
jgi:exopolyphosphatase/guanosine-5'-triphosphate,3'-diphosphate pyrophosphatase